MKEYYINAATAVLAASNLAMVGARSQAYDTGVVCFNGISKRYIDISKIAKRNSSPITFGYELFLEIVRPFCSSPTDKDEYGKEFTKVFSEISGKEINEILEGNYDLLWPVFFAVSNGLNDNLFEAE